MQSIRSSWAVLLVTSVMVSTVSADAADQIQRYDNHKVVRLQVESPLDIAFVENLGIDVWTHHPVVGEIDVCADAAQLDALSRGGFRYETWIDNVQALVDAERAGARGTGFFDDYHNYADILAYLEQLVANHPTLANMVDVGTTIEGRTIRGIHIAGPNADDLSPAVVYFSAVHAREWIATTIPSYVANHLLSNYGTDPEVTQLVDNVHWYLIPVGNPDGYEYSRTSVRLWRKNRRNNGGGDFGVDINRNWGFGWGGEGASGSPSSDTYRGPAPFSEPETTALRDFFLSHPNVRAQLDIHSYSQLILWPYGFTNDLPENQARYDAIGQAMRQSIFDVHGRTYDIGPVYSAIYPVSGGSLDWTHGERGIFSYSFELRDTGNFGFLLPASQIIPNNEEILPAILDLSGSDEVLATQFIIFGEAAEVMTSGQAKSMSVGVTSGVETINPSSVSLYYRYDASGPFIVEPMVQVNGAEFLAELPATNCTSTPEYFFSATTSNGLVTMPVDAPSTVYTAVVQQDNTIYSATMDTDPGWSGTGQWAWGQPTGQGGDHGGPDPTSGYTGSNVYGYNLNGDYSSNLSTQTLTTGAIDCTGRTGVQLSFWRWLGVEQPIYDEAAIKVSNNGVNWTTIWSNDATISDSSWVEQTFDLSAIADGEPNVQIRWSIGPTDSSWQYCGWNIDDVRVYSTECIAVYGDHNGDAQIDLIDFVAFADCLQGPDGGLLPGCGVFDAKLDGDVDLADLMQLQQAQSQP